MHMIFGVRPWRLGCTRWLVMKSRVALAGGVLGALFVCGAASAQEQVAPPPAAPPPPAAVPTYPAYATTAVSTTTITSAEPQVAMPKPKSCGLINHACKVPHFTLAVDGGAAAFNESGPLGFGTGTGAVTSGGPSWGVRVGAELLSWLAVDAHYMGMSNSGRGAATPNGDVRLLTSAVTGEVRFTAPLPYVHPYVYGGAGVYSTSVTGDDSAQAASPMHGSTEFGVPMGAGIDVPIKDGISAGAEVTYHRFFGEEFSGTEEIGGGDLTTANAVIRARL